MGGRTRWRVWRRGAGAQAARAAIGAEDIHRRPFRRLAPEFSLQGPNSILALVVSFGTNVPTCRAACVHQQLWNGTRTVSGLWQDMTNGSLSLAPPPISKVLEVTIDPALLPASSSMCDEDYNKYESAAYAQAMSVYGVDRTDYTMRLLYLPDSMATACGWGGLAYIGCSYWYCTAWIIQPYDQIVAHELGHSAGIFFGTWSVTPAACLPSMHLIGPMKYCPNSRV